FFFLRFFGERLSYQRECDRRGRSPGYRISDQVSAVWIERHILLTPRAVGTTRLLRCAACVCGCTGPLTNSHRDSVFQGYCVPLCLIFKDSGLSSATQSTPLAPRVSILVRRQMLTLVVLLATRT